MQAVEFRCELRDPDLARILLRSMGAMSAGSIEADDAYFRVPTGYLKRRSAAGEPSDFVSYRKPKRAGQRMTRFLVMSEQDAARELGTAALETWVSVRKRREIYLVDAVNVYLDDVEGLGRFFKAEVMVSARLNAIRAHERVMRVRQTLRHALGEAVSGSYADLALAGAA